MTDCSTKLVNILCPDHQKTLVAGLYDSLIANRGVDFSAHLGPRTVLAHRLVVEVFLPPEKLGPGASADSCHNHFDHLDNLLQFIYKGAVSVKYDQLDSLLDVAKELNFGLLVEAVESSRNAETQNQFHTVPGKSTNISKTGTKLRPKIVDRKRPRKKRNVELRSTTVELDTSDSNLPVKKRQLPPKSRVKPDNPAEEPNELVSEVTSRYSSADEEDDSSDSSCPSAVTGRLQKQSQMATGYSPTAKPTSKFECEHCDYVTRSKTQFQVHASKHDPSIVVYRCESCRRPFFSEDKLASHRAKHNVYKCGHCDYETPKRWVYYEHLFAEHKVNAKGEPVTLLGCSACPFTCKAKHELKYHVATKHLPEKPFKCGRDGCLFSAGRRSDIGVHVKVVHEKKKPFMCEKCGYCAVTPFSLERHRTIHFGLKPFQCQTCQMSFKDRYALARHCLLHDENNRNFTCEICGRSFNRKSNMTAHMRNVHKKDSVGSCES